MDALSAPLFELELGPDKMRLAPKSIDELAAWVTQEYGAWEKVHGASNPPGQDGSFLNEVTGVLKTLSRAKTSAHSAQLQTDADRSKSLESARSQINEVFNRHRLPLSDSLRGQFLTELAREDPFAAKVALFAIGVAGPTNSQVPLVSPATVRGLVYGSLLLRPSNTSMSEAAVQRLLSEGEKQLTHWTAEHDRAIERVDKTHRELEQELGAFKTQVSAARDNADALNSELRENFNAELKAAKETLEKFRDVTTKDIALKAPTEYWRGKAKGHRRNAVWLFVVLVLLMVGFGVAADVLFPNLLTETPDGKKIPSYGHIAVIVILATLAFWVLRIMVRLFFSQTHLAQDAQERVTMVTTYLALMETGKFDAGDLAIVLNALFRNATDGIVKDEGMPPSLWEIVTRQGK